LIYAVPTLTTAETTGLLASFLDDHPDFRFDPFPHPFENGATTGQLQLYPSQLASEGWYIAALIRRTGPTPSTQS
jgi:16S rRNA (cytosine967-C5)-methyltransferase